MREAYAAIPRIWVWSFFYGNDLFCGDRMLKAYLAQWANPFFWSCSKPIIGVSGDIARKIHYESYAAITWIWQPEVPVNLHESEELMVLARTVIEPRIP